jgi:hypothetical protein
MQHPHDPQRFPADGLEAGAQRVADRGVVDVEAARSAMATSSSTLIAGSSSTRTRLKSKYDG